MKQYLDLMNDILENGIEKTDRTGVGTKSVFGRTMKFDLSEGFPMITTRKVSFRLAFEETMFFLRGETNTKLLEEKNINIWKGNTSREFLDSRGLHDLPEGDMGKGYSYQWTNYDKHEIRGYRDSVEHFDGSKTYLDAKVTVTHINQVKEMLENMKTDPHSRRNIITAWNPADLDSMALPPCHIYHQYYVNGDKLDSVFFMRSNDYLYGNPFNIMGYAFLNIAFSKILGLTPGTLTYMAGDVHLYTNQIEMAKEQVTREPRPLPTLKFKKEFSTFEELLKLEWKDIEIIGYDPHPDFKNKPPMSV